MPNVVKNDLSIEPGAAISIQKAMGMESKKKATRQQIPESPIVDIPLDGLQFADLKIQTADVAEALKRLAQIDNLAAIVEAAGLDNVAENLRQGVGEADGPEVAIVYVRDADGQMKQIKNEKKSSADPDHDMNLPENTQGSSSEKEDKNGDKEGAQVIEI